MSTPLEKETRSHKILVVDDDPAIRVALEARLEHEGYKVFTASDGTQAIVRFNEHGPDLIILDIMMPDIDGFEVCQAIKNQEDVPVIFLTGAQHQMVKNYLPQLAEAAGGDHYMRKPFEAESLLKLIEDIVANDERCQGK